MIGPAPALACAPLPPMTEEEAVRAAAAPPLIVYGEFVAPVAAEPPFKAWSRIRIIHVYKGAATAGSHVTLMNDTCMIWPLMPPIPAGSRAYVAIGGPVDGVAWFHLVSGEALFRYGLIDGPRFPDPAPRPHGSGELNYVKPAR